MLSKGQIAFLVVDIVLGVLGWIAFAVFYDSWQSLRSTPEERREWLYATIGLIVGILSIVLLVLFALIAGALYAKKHSKERLITLQHESARIPNLNPSRPGQT
jgi:H+/Cl- antiporter ClcA